MKKILACVAVAALFGAQAQAATLEKSSGDVLVNHGKGFVPAGGSVELVPGDRVKLGAKASARLAYSDGCSVAVPANALVTISKQSPCAFKAQSRGNAPLPVADEFLPFFQGSYFIPAAALAAIGAGLGVGISEAGSSSDAASKCTLVPVSGGAVCIPG